MNPTVDPDLLKLVQQHVNVLKTDVDQMTLELKEDKERVLQALEDISTSLEELEARVASVQQEQEVMKQEQSSLSNKMDNLETDMDRTQVQLKSLKCQQEDMQQQFANMEEKMNSTFENRGENSEGFIRLTLYMAVFMKTVMWSSRERGSGTRLVVGQKYKKRLLKKRYWCLKINKEISFPVRQKEIFGTH